MKRRVIMMVVLAATMLSVSAFAAVSVNRTGDAMRATTAADFMRHPHRNKYYTESWTAILQADDGHEIYVNFAYTNIGVVSGSAGVNMSITAPGAMGKKWAVEHAVGDYSENQGQGMIKIGPNQMTLKGNKLTIAINDNGMVLNITMKGWYPNGYKFYDGKTFVNDARDKYFLHFFHMPRGDFEGDMTWEGRTVHLRGAGYMDHMVNNRLTSEWSRRWWTVRYFAPNYTLAFISMKMDPKFGGETITRAFFGNRSRALAVTDQMTLSTTQVAHDNRARHDYFTRYDITMNGEGFHLQSTFQSRRLHDRDAVVEGLPAVQQGIAKMFAGNPVVYRMEGRTEMKVTEGTAAEVKTTGTALMETIVIED